MFLDGPFSGMRDRHAARIDIHLPSFPPSLTHSVTHSRASFIPFAPPDASRLIQSIEINKSYLNFKYKFIHK